MAEKASPKHPTTLLEVDDGRGRSAINVENKQVAPDKMLSLSEATDHHAASTDKMLWRRFFGYHKLFVLVPVLVTAVLTVLRGIGPMCTFTAHGLQDHVPELAQRFTRGELNGEVTLGIPTNFWWVGVVDGVVGSTAVATSAYFYLNVMAIIPVQAADKEMNSLSPSQVPMRSFLLAYALPISLVAFAWVAVLFIIPRSPTGMTSARSSFGLASPVIGAICCVAWSQTNRWWFRRKNNGEMNAAGGAAAAPRLMRTRSLNATVGLQFILGVVALLMGGTNIYVANVVFPAALRKIEELPPAVQPFLQLGLATFFFSIWLPLAMEKLWGRAVLPFILPKKKHFLPDEAAADQVHGEDYFSTSGNIEKSIAKRTTMMRIFGNTLFDALRFAFGRGVLSSLSPIALAVLIFKDITYHLWHFGLRQRESLVLFTVRISHPDPWTRSRITLPSWRRLSEFLFHLQRFSSISRRLAVAFEDRIDYRELMRAAVARKQMDTQRQPQPQQVHQQVGGSALLGEQPGAPAPAVASDELRLHFCNQRIILEHVPRDVLHAFFRDSENTSHGAIDVKGEGEAKKGSTAMDGGSDDEKHSPQQKEDATSPAKQNRTVADEVDNADILSASSAADGVNDGPSMSNSKPSADTTNVAELSTGEASVAVQSTTSRAVTREEMKVLRAFVRFYRQQNFIRYQIRAQTRIVVALLMLIVPLISATGNIAYYAGFPKEGGEFAAALRVSVVLLGKDLIEWYVITFRIVLFDVHQLRELMPGLLKALCDFCPTREWFAANEPGQLLTFGVLVTVFYYGFLIYNLRYNPFNLGEIQRETGFGDALSWDHIMDFCETK
mmetsp:Transcript_22232/g.56091  ORF Transcript_22232/g.56091 Transcript_22232/m.56091 type:complete len:837 (-) Transcript_22232:658-3168(-)